ncbi:hypothetical protein N7492_001894 [Penicillium capsulatum]|uniref:Uncharacterized protein n=1 Tax=Penicillium capsulatum TaxID=69766 RepID=A0A9W9IU38_9EURO|nr:hypothetical protein N7492_001894 [Penicillium capsulatum]
MASDSGRKVAIVTGATQTDAFREAFRRWGRIDALCANAGIVHRSSIYIYNWRGKPFDNVPPEPDLSTTDVDYKAVIYGVQLATHFMRHNPQPGVALS